MDSYNTEMAYIDIHNKMCEVYALKQLQQNNLTLFKAYYRRLKDQKDKFKIPSRAECMRKMLAMQIKTQSDFCSYINKHLPTFEDLHLADSQIIMLMFEGITAFGMSNT